MRQFQVGGTGIVLETPTKMLKLSYFGSPDFFWHLSNIGFSFGFLPTCAEKQLKLRSIFTADTSLSLKQYVWRIQSIAPIFILEA